MEVAFLRFKPGPFVYQRFGIFRQLPRQFALFGGNPIFFVVIVVRGGFVGDTGRGDWRKEFDHAEIAFLAIMILNGIDDPEIFAACRRNHRIDEIEYRCGRTKTSRQRQILQFKICFGDTIGECLSRFAVSFRRGPLKSINCLFEISNREQRTYFFIARTQSAVKISTQGTNNFPLSLIGVL